MAGGQDKLSKRQQSAGGSNNALRVSDASWEYGKQHLVNQPWSPEQISGRLKLEGRDNMSHETIYLRILEDKNNGGALYTHLRCKNKRYGSGKSGRGAIPHRVDIDQ